MAKILDKFSSGPIKSKCEHSFILIDSFKIITEFVPEKDQVGNWFMCQHCLLTISRREIDELNKEHARHLD